MRACVRACVRAVVACGMCWGRRPETDLKYLLINPFCFTMTNLLALTWRKKSPLLRRPFISYVFFPFSSQVDTPKKCLYPNFSVTMTLEQFRSKWAHLSPGARHEYDDDDGSGISIALAGRIRSRRDASRKLSFFDFCGGGQLPRTERSLQILAQEKYLGPNFLDRNYQRGDIVGIRGFPGKSNTGELSIVAREMVMLAPCLRPLPDTARNVVRDHDIRFRKRYVDFLTNESARNVLIKRSKVINYLRQFLIDRDFLEVETPVLSVSAGGATARPFETSSVAFSKATDLFLRIAPELYLKKLIIGGFDRVFEIGKVFRNEGIDSAHNPEFTSCEFYMTYSDYSDIMDLTEELFRGLVYYINGSHVVHENAENAPIDFSRPFERIGVIEGIEKYAKITIPRPLDSPETKSFLDDLLIERGIRLSAPRTTARMLDKLVEHFIEDQIVDRPTFIIDHPKIMSPLAKTHSSDEDLTERFELFINKKEFCNSYSELNDPDEQFARFTAQAEAKSEGDVEAHVFDHDFCEALAHGLPPTAGWGLGVDRLVMLLTGNDHIREVITFPTVRPKEAVRANIE